MSERNDEAARAAALILDSFLDYHERFADITRRARRRFERRDWRLSPLDATSRIDLSRICLDEGLARLDRLADERIRARGFWEQAKIAFANQTAALPDRALARTWFNSLSRRQFQTEGVASSIEFTAHDMERISAPGIRARIQTYSIDGDLAGAFERVFDDFPFGNGYAHAPACAGLIAQALAARVGHSPVEMIELLKPVFFRERRGYLVGRFCSGGNWKPLIIALVSTENGVLTDAILTDPIQIAVLFGYTRSYFQVDLNCVAAVVAFLHALMPTKPIDELYTVLGRARHGKTERYRALAEHLARNPDERLVRADGDRGMVMAVFTCSAYPLLDYGQAIKDLARSNIFPGDLLLKNFGVARSGRAVFYDYDELCLVSECRFRSLPEPREGDETRPVEDYVSFGDHDIFPEQFPRFLGVPARLRDALVQRHPEIFDATWWRSLQEGMRHGEWIDVPPYPSTAKLSREPN